MAEDVYRKEDNENTPETVKTKDAPEESKSNTSVSSSEKITVKVGKNYDSFNNTIAEIENTAKYPERGHESFMINKKTHSAIAIRQNGQINLSSSLYSQYKLNPSGKSVEQTLESVAITNRRKVLADDMVLNEHKLNPYLYEITDMKKLETAHNDHMLVGNMCLFGSVLVKAWEQNLHRYVLLRRPIRIPMFSPMLNVPEINKGLGVTDPLKVDEDILAKSNKGFQVNKVYTDSASLIGKDGVDRPGINRNANLAVSADVASVDANGNIISKASKIDVNNINVNVNAVNLDGMNEPGKGGGQGSDKVNQLISYGTSAGHSAPSEEALTALKAASQAAGIPMDWIMGMWIHEVGWDLAGNKSAIEFKNYGNMHGDSTKLSVLQSAGVKCELAHWSADGTSDWVKFDDAAEAGKGWAVWIRYAYSEPPACQQKTAEAFYRCLFDNTGAGWKHGYAGDGTWAGAGSSYASASLDILSHCGGGTTL
jgi:hypothetical protein